MTLSPVSSGKHIPPFMATQQTGPGAELVSVDGRRLPLEGATLYATAHGGVCRVVLEQRFRNVHREPLSVTYRMPLPADGAVSGYEFEIGNRRVVGEVDRKQRARERFEQAIAQGRTAALLDQETSSVFTQEIGNIPPGAEIKAEITVDQRLIWLPEGEWEWRFPTVIGPRYMGEAASIDDVKGARIEVADRAMRARVAMRLTVGDELAEGREVESPSHVLGRGEQGEVTLAAEEGAALDRDVVVRWAVSRPEVGVSLSTARPPRGKPHETSAYGLLTLVPPSDDARLEPLPRDLIVLLDTSGSMGGDPLEKAKQVVCALIDSLDERDQIEIIEFSDRPRRWRDKPVHADAQTKRDAMKWVRGLSASGGTEMYSGVLEALSALRPRAQRQVLLVTDGLIGGEKQIVTLLHEKMPERCRMHVLGVGSATNRTLSASLARAGRGCEVLVGLNEDPERAARRLVSRTASPILTEVTLSGDALQEHAPARVPDVFEGSPLLVAVKLRPEGGELVVRGQLSTGVLERRIRVAGVGPGEGDQSLVSLYGREVVEDLETRFTMADGASRIDREIESVGLVFQIATRLTSWVAIHDEVMVDPAAPRRSETVPQELPHGMSIEGLGLRPASAGGVLFSLKEMMSLEDGRVTGAFAAAPSMAPVIDDLIQESPMSEPFAGSGGYADKRREEARHAMAPLSPASMPRRHTSRGPWLFLLLLLLVAVAIWFAFLRR